MRMKVRMLAMEESSAVPEEKKRNSSGPGYEPYLNGLNEGKLLNSNEDEVDGSSESRIPSRSSGYEENIRVNSPDRKEMLPYVLNSTPPSGNSDLTPSPEVNQKKTAEIIMSPDRKVKAIKLKKDTRGALGLTVVGGEDTRRLHFGIFIKRISPGSIAHEDGRLQVGDRILAVNGKSLEYVSHDEAVQALKNTPVDVELLVSQSTRTENNVDMAALYSPSPNKTQHPSSSGEHRVSSYLVQEHAPPGNMNSGHGNEQVTIRKVSRNLESSYAEDVSGYQGNENPQSLRPADAISSNPSSAEQYTRRNHYGGVKLPGMTDGRMEDVKLSSNFRKSVTSQVSLESPGSIASFGEKVNRQNSLPDSDAQYAERKSSTGSAYNDGTLNRSHSNSGNIVSVDIDLNDATSDVQQLPVGIVMDRAEHRVSQESKVQAHFTVELLKVSGSLGLNVAGGINTGTADGGIFVKSLYPNGPADLDGRIQVGHKILSVNGISLQGVTHKQAVETIKRAPVHTVLVMEGLPGQPADHVDNDSHQNDEQETVFEVVLMKGIGGLGMSLVGGTDGGDEYGDQLRIKAMFPGQPAENSGKLRVGDIIMSANGIPLAGKTSRNAINVLRDQPTRVVLTVKRDPSSIPPSLLRRASFSLDPYEVLAALNSRLNRDESRHSAFDCGPGSEESTPREVRDHHASAVRKSSHTTENSESLRDERRSRNGSGRASGGNCSREDTSMDDGRAIFGSSEARTEDISEILPDKSRRPQIELTDNEGHHGFNDASLDSGTTSRANSGEPNDDLGSQLPSKHLSNNRNALDYDHTAFDTRTKTVDSSGGSDVASFDEKYVLPGCQSRGRLSSEDNDFQEKERSLEDDPSVLKRDIQPPLENSSVTLETGEGDDEGCGEERRKNSEIGTFQNDKKKKLAPPEEVLDIVLHKGSSGLGFTLAGGADTVGGCFVREIIGDPARSDGRLKPKDQIVMVNGQDTTNKKHMEAVNILRSTRNEVHLVIRRRPDKVKSKTSDGLNIKTISVIRTARGVIGLTLGQDDQRQIYAAEVLPDEPAAKDGGLKRGDVILEINGERLDGTDLSVAVDCLERARPVVTLVIKQFRSETESKYVLFSPTESDDEVPPNSSRAHNYDIAVLPPPNSRMQEISTYNPDFLPSGETFSENLPTGVFLPETEPIREPQVPVLLPSENLPLKEPHIELMQNKNKSFEPSEQDLPGERNTESLSADESFSEEKITSFDTREKEGDTSQGQENEEYVSDDDDLILKEEVIVTSLEKGPRGLGFSLFSGQTVHDTPGLFIRSIQPNSVVAEDGKIKVGDQLMKVNGKNVERLDHSEVITLLRSLSGLIELELLRFLDCVVDEEASTSLPRQPDISEQTRDSDVVLDTSTSPVTTPDFSEDVGIVLDALHTKWDLPLPNSQESLPTHVDKRPCEKADVLRKTSNESVETEEERLESWPQPPPSLELQCGNVMQEPNNSIENHIATSEEETTSITFSEDGFLEELEDLQYTPSPESERVRPGNISERSGIPVKPGSTLSNSVSPRLSAQLNNARAKQENIEMSVFGRSSNIEHSGAFKDKPRLSMHNLVENTVAETSMSLLEGSVSPLIPESFLNASVAASSSQATSPEVPPPLPTTPIPSDEDLSGNAGQNVTPRDPMRMRERFVEVVKQENKGRFDYPLRPKSPLVGRRSKSVEPLGPLLTIVGSSSLYSGQQLQTIIQKLENTIMSGKAAGEFQELREMEPVDNCPSGKRALNKEKNRYRNVLPYEKTRVILSGDEQMDYINANFIKVTVDADTYYYIATQGPLPITTSDFWRMVWEQKSQVVAMVTLDMECGKVKCHQYWPESSELPVKVGPSLEVYLESVETHDNFIERIMRIDDIQEGQSLKVTHLNFIAWPDHGVPKSAFELVRFIKQFRKNPSVGPYVVHCSAGIGRTGTLLTIDTCMKYIERGLEFDIHGIVHDLRMQRPGMIQTKDQYLFCYQACVEILKSLQVRD